jgi:hypothetical protein
MILPAQLIRALGVYPLGQRSRKKSRMGINCGVEIHFS